VTVDVWRKIREDGSTGLLAVLSGIAGAIRGGGSLPEVLRRRWRLRETREQLADAYAELGKHVADTLTAGGSVETTDDQARRLSHRIDELLAVERQVREELARGNES
jgi:hypothetical protein